MYEILQNRALVEVSGSDSLRFLQGLITNDIIAYRYCYTYMLSNQGRYVSDFFILNMSDNNFLIDIALNSASNFIAKLMTYKLRAKVDIVQNTDKYSVLYSKEELKQSNVIASNKDPRYPALGFRSIILRTDDLYNGQGNIYFEDKYHYAIPDGDIDLIYEKSIPLEYGARELNAISYKKGCYVGQEFISRSTYYGVIRKKIFKAIDVSGENNLITENLIPQSNNIGILCSKYNNLGIALVNEEKNFELIQNPVFFNGIKMILCAPGWRK